MKCVYCISVSYRKADIEIRKSLKFDEEKCRKISTGLVGKGIVSQCVILSTCNRFEIYFCGEKGAENDVIKSVSTHSGISAELFSRYIMLYADGNAVLHLFKVASGIDSMIIGEDEILGQTKNAYALALENNTVSYELNMIFQAAVACAKKIKTQTPLSKTSVSVATLSANEAAKLGNNVNALVIGASGQIGKIVLKNLASHKNINVKAVLRKHSDHRRLIESMGIETADYNDRYDFMNSADCIISATSSPHYTVTRYDLKDRLTDKKSRLFIDLAVPPDIDKEIAELDGVRLINIDYFEQLAKENNALKLSSVDIAEEIILAEINTLRKDMEFHDFMPELESIKNKLNNKSLEQLIYKMKSEVSADTFSEFLNVLKSF